MVLPAESSCCSGGEKEPKEPKPVKDKSKKADDKTKDGKGSGKPSPYQVSESEMRRRGEQSNALFADEYTFPSLIVSPRTLRLIHRL